MQLMDQAHGWGPCKGVCKFCRSLNVDFNKKLSKIHCNTCGMVYRSR